MRLIRKCKNRKLYDVQTSSYIKLDDLAEILRENDKDFKILDYDTKEDFTAPILIDAIFEKEKNAKGPIPTDILKKIMICGMPDFLSRKSKVHRRKKTRLKNSGRVS